MWNRNLASSEWFRQFIKRQHRLSLGKDPKPREIWWCLHESFICKTFYIASEIAQNYALFDSYRQDWDRIDLLLSSCRSQNLFIFSSSLFLLYYSDWVISSVLSSSSLIISSMSSIPLLGPWIEFAYFSCIFSSKILIRFFFIFSIFFAEAFNFVFFFNFFCNLSLKYFYDNCFKLSIR